MDHIFFMHFSVSGHLDCFQALGIVSSAAMNTRVHISFQLMLFSGWILYYILENKFVNISIFP